MAHRPFTHHRRSGLIMYTRGQAAVIPRPPRSGIKRQPREPLAPELALSDRHAAVLALLGDEPVRVVDLASPAGLSYQATTSALYALQARGLVAKLPNGRGWQRNAPPTPSEG
jgi:predicted Rossmann fold nucleotide-binding protein DprA/Smf involved in DNA uptake